MATTYETLRADIIAAVKARDSVSATALRTADAAIQRAAMDSNQEINEALVGATMRKSVKNLVDANTEFAKAGRNDLVDANLREIGILEKYLPKGMDDAQLEVAVGDAIKSTGAQSRKEMGKVMAALKARPDAAVIDFSKVSKMIQAKLP